MSLSPALQRELRRKHHSPCPQCGEPNPSAITKAGICYACDLLARGRSQTEQHHPIGRKNGTETLTMPANVHRALSEAQATWPEPLRTNPANDPLISIAQVIRAVADFSAWLAARGERISDWLLALSLWLRDRIGLQWWMELAPLW